MSAGLLICSRGWSVRQSALQSAQVSSCTGPSSSGAPAVFAVAVLWPRLFLVQSPLIVCGAQQRWQLLFVVFCPEMSDLHLVDPAANFGHWCRAHLFRH